MEYKNYELVRERHGVAFVWHVYDQTGHRLTSLGYRSKAAAKRFCCDRALLALATGRVAEIRRDAGH